MEKYIHTYLALKYGIGIYYLNYVSSKDSIIWNTYKTINSDNIKRNQNV